MLTALRAISVAGGDAINVREVQIIPDTPASVPSDRWPFIGVLPGDRIYQAHPPGYTQIDWSWDLVALAKGNSFDNAQEIGEGLERDIKRTVFQNARSPNGGSLWSVDVADFIASTVRGEDQLAAMLRIRFKIKWREQVDEAP